MAEDDRDKWNWVPKPSFNSKNIAKRMRKVETATMRHAHKFIVSRWSNVRDVQQHVITWIIAVGLLIAATGLQLVWYQESYRTTAAAENGTYAEAVLGPVKSLNPIFASTSAEQSISHLMFSSILKYDASGNLNHDLATSIAIDSTGTIYTVTIRSDAKWSDGQALTASDIAFTANLLKDSDTRATISGWSGVETTAIDAATVEFKLSSAYAAFQHALTFPILPEHILKGISPANIYSNDFSQNPVGSGPFKLNFVQNTDSSENKIIYLARNDDYYGGTAKLTRFQLNVYSKTSEILSALSSNEVNAAADLSITDIDSVDENRYYVESEPIQSGVYALINTKGETLSNASLRQALQLATDTAAIRKVLPDTTKALYLPFTEKQLTGDLPAAPQYNLDTAKKMLDDDGWTLNKDGLREKDGKTLKISIVTVKSSELERVLEVLSGQWRQLGIAIETRVVDPEDVSQNIVQNILQPRNYDVLLYRLDIGADPDVYAYWHSSQATNKGLNYSNYSNVISDDALLSARMKNDDKLRNAKYVTFAKQWLTDVPAIGLYQSTAQYVYSKQTQTFDKNVVFNSAVDRYSSVLDWSIGSQSVYKTP